MEKKKIVCCLFVFGVFLWLLPPTGEGAIIPVNCSPGLDTIQAKHDGAASGDTLSVTGTCSENVDITIGVIIDGNSTAVINGPDNTQPTFRVRASSVTIKNFASIQGGYDGIYTSGYGPTIENNTIQNTARDGVFVVYGGCPTIKNNTIQNTARTGITVYANSFATIINNLILNNPQNGINVVEVSVARIGINSTSDTSASPNTITGNGLDGIQVSHTSNARIVGNTISNNTAYGVRVVRNSHADISYNTINNNGESGIRLYADSAVNLGNDTGSTIFDLPNSTTVNNVNKGIQYALGSYVDGRLGTLNGVNGASDMDGIGIKTSSIADVTGEYGIDVVTTSNGLIQLGNGTANNTIKAARMVVRHYDNSQLPVYLFGSASTATANFVAFGGGNTVGNAATQLDLFTAPNNTTPQGTARLTIIGNGNVGIGTQIPSNPLQMASGAHVTVGGVWTDNSSREYKDNIQALTTEEAFVTLKELNPVKFAYKVDSTEKHVGFIAEEVPDLIATKDRKGLSPMDIVAVLTKVIQEQQKTISGLSEKIADLERALK